MKSLVVWATTLVCLSGSAAFSLQLECPAYLPAGTVIRAFPDETLTAGTSSGPTILTVTSDVRFFPNRPPLLQRGSKILANIAESKEAGRLWGKARSRLTLTSILTADFCEYPIDAQIVEAGSFKVEENVVVGKGHTKRDVFALLFPPTTIYQLLRLPGRGPKLAIDPETPIVIKLMEPVSISPAARSAAQTGIDGLRTRLEQAERNITRLNAAPPVQPLSPDERAAIQPAIETCPASPAVPMFPVVNRGSVLRPVRNHTPHHVSLYVDQIRIAVLPPCYGPSFISTPASRFKLEAVASILTSNGQGQIQVRMVPNTLENGWDIVSDEETPLQVDNGRQPR